jgi:hypothetical protein
LFYWLRFWCNSSDKLQFHTWAVKNFSSVAATVDESLSLMIQTWHMKGFDSVHAASESWALLSFLLKPSVTQLTSVSFPVGICVHNAVSLTKVSATTVPDEHHEKVRSAAQKRPSLLAEVQ